MIERIVRKDVFFCVLFDFILFVVFDDFFILFELFYEFVINFGMILM